jgi:hypothetical protein
MAPSAALPIQSVAELLPLKDWLHLCGEVDRLCSRAVKFDVLDVVRDGDELNVTIQLNPSRAAIKITLKSETLKAV